MGRLGLDKWGVVGRVGGLTCGRTLRFGVASLVGRAWRRLRCGCLVGWESISGEQTQAVPCSMEISKFVISYSPRSLCKPCNYQAF